MKSGLRDRNNYNPNVTALRQVLPVSMKSGLRDRNNVTVALAAFIITGAFGLNEVRS